MTAGGATASAKPSRTQLEMEAGRRTAERHAGQDGSTNGIAISSETIDTGMVAAVAANQPRDQDINHGTPPAERLPESTGVPGEGRPPTIGEITATINFGAARSKRATAPEPPTNWNDIQNFMNAVVPWPVDNIGHVNLHYSMVNPRASEPGQERLLKGMGWPFKEIIPFIERAAWINNTNNFKDVWYCTSRQREVSTNTKGKPKALRRHANAMDLKAIWVDIDVGNTPDAPDKHYDTMQDAWAAICAFRTKVGLPQFSAVVNSGGGLHVYWISDRALEPAQWLPYAAGLKALLLREGIRCDAGLTTDDVRLLRVPGTFNHKYDPPREVTLLPIPLTTYNFENQLSFLKTIAPTPLIHAATAPQIASGFIGKKPAAAFAALDANGGYQLGAGIGKREFGLLDPLPVFKQCAFMGDALANGGADYDNPLWNLSVLCTTFIENGNAYAHAISKGHATYTEVDTQALYHRKVAERADRGIGYPSCATIAGNGCKACATCPHFAKGKSPLHLGLDRTTPKQESQTLGGNVRGQKTKTENKGQELKYESVAGDAPELAKLENVWLTRIFDGDTDGKYEGDRSRLAFSVACELVRAELDGNFIARVLMTTKCGEHVQESPARRLERTITRAHDFAIDPDLEEMNSKHAVLPIGDKTRVVTWGPDPDFTDRKAIVRAQTFFDFTNLHSNKRKVFDTGEIGDDGKSIKKKSPLGGWWLRQERRRQYEGGQRFMPQYDAEVVNETLNMYTGFAVNPVRPKGRSGAAGCQLFLDHGFKIMCSGNEEHWNYLLKREAWIVQQRRRSEIAAAYRTEAEGSGKGFWCTHLGHLYGQHFMQVGNPDHVIGKHNPHLETLIKLCADEALFVGDPRHRNALFSMITEPTLTIEPKFVGVYTARNYLNIDITTNAEHFVPASRTARRFFIPTVSENRVGDLAYFKKIENQLKDGGYEALLYHLLNEVDLQDFDVRRVPKTAGLAEQVEYSRKGLDGLIEQICNRGRVPNAHRQWPGFSISNGYEIKQGFDYFIDTHLDRELHDFGALKVKRQLRRDWGCVAGDDAKRRDGGDMIYGVKWPPLAELREMFVKRHGPQDWLHPEVTEWLVSPSAQALNDQDMPLDCRQPPDPP